MPDDATESVAEHSSELHPSINLHAPVITFMFSCSVTDVLPQRDEGLGKPSPVIEPYSTQSGLKPGAGFKIRKKNS